jgi:endoplasmic reticulum-Golgi intermediate compartment protein 2
MYKFQYFLSVVPTTYIVNDFNQKVIDTFQYAATQQSHPSANAMGYDVPGILHTFSLPPTTAAKPQRSYPSRACSRLTVFCVGIFFKFDVEPILLTVEHDHISTYRFLMRLIALIGGVMSCTEWLYKGIEALAQKRDPRRLSSSDGLLNGLLEKGR